jgi:TolB protein
MTRRQFTQAVPTLCLLAGARGLFAADAPIGIAGTGLKLRPGDFIPVSLTGFTGEVASALKFDLEIAGFDIVNPEQATFLISGSNSGRLEGRLTDKHTKTVHLSKAYAGDNSRRLAHAFADDIVQAVTGKRGIAQTRIVFKVDTGRNSELYLADYDGHNAVPVTNDSSIVAAPCWAPDNRALYYTTYKSGPPWIVWHNLSTGDRQFVATHGGLNTSPAVSPNGRQLAMILSKAGSPDLYVAGHDGSEPKRLTTTREDESSPCWSPDGRQLCFASRLTGRAQLYTVSSSGGEMRRLSTSGVANATEPDWSPDGKQIVFTSLMGSFNVCVIPAGGGSATVLAEGEDPSWAPNSRHVIFTRRVGGRRVLSLLDVSTKRVKDVKQVSGSSSQPGWSR